MDTSSTKETNQPRPGFFHDLNWDKTCFFVSLFVCFFDCFEPTEQSCLHSSLDASVTYIKRPYVEALPLSANWRPRLSKTSRRRRPLSRRHQRSTAHTCHRKNRRWKKEPNSMEFGALRLLKPVSLAGIPYYLMQSVFFCYVIFSLDLSLNN